MMDAHVDVICRHDAAIYILFNFSIFSHMSFYDSFPSLLIFVCVFQSSAVTTLHRSEPRKLLDILIQHAPINANT